MKKLLFTAAVMLSQVACIPKVAEAQPLDIWNLEKPIVEQHNFLQTRYNRKVYVGSIWGLMQLLEANPNAAVKVYFHSNTGKPGVNVGGQGNPWATCHSYLVKKGEGLVGADTVCVAVDDEGQPLDKRIDSKAYRLAGDRLALR